MVDRRCRESEGKAKIKGYMSVSDEEAHQQHVAVTGSSAVTCKVSASVAIAPHNSSARASVWLHLTDRLANFFDGSI